MDLILNMTQCVISFDVFCIYKYHSFSYLASKNKMLFQLSSVCANTGEQENIDKFTKRLVKVTKQHNDECKKLLTLMGVPFVEVG